MTQPQFEPYDNEETLNRLYWGAGLSQNQIAKKFGVSQRDVSRAMHRHSIETRKPRRTGAKYKTRSADGYEAWQVSDVGENRTIYVHQLVAVANGEDPQKIFNNQEWVVHHDNGVKWDNRPENLILMGRSEHNILHHERGDIDYHEYYTEDELLEWLESFVEELGFVPKASDIHGWPGPTAKTYSDRFGTFTNALKEAGYTPRSEQ